MSKKKEVKELTPEMRKRVLAVNALRAQGMLADSACKKVKISYIVWNRNNNKLGSDKFIAPKKSKKGATQAVKPSGISINTKLAQLMALGLSESTMKIALRDLSM